MATPVGTEPGSHPPGRGGHPHPRGPGSAPSALTLTGGGCEAPRVPPSALAGCWRGSVPLVLPGGAPGNLLNCNSCCRAKPQQKPFSTGAFPVRSHRCHSPCPLLSPLRPPTQPDPRCGHHPRLPSLLAGGASCVCVLGRRRRRRGWVGFFSLGGTGFFAGSPSRGTPGCGWGGGALRRPGGLPLFRRARGGGTGGSCWTEASAAPHSRDAFRPLAPPWDVLLLLPSRRE